MTSHIPSELQKQVALKIYRKRSKLGIAGTPDTDWNDAKKLLRKQPWRIGWWWLKQNLVIQTVVLLLVSPLKWILNVASSILSFILFPFKLGYRVQQIPDDQSFWEGFSDTEKKRAFRLEIIKITLSALSLFATVVAGAGLIATYWDNLEDRRLTQERLVTERFSKAISFLDEHNDETVRIGGIYALERIAKDSPKDHWTIMEVLTSYIRKHSPLVPENESYSSVSIDVQAALTVIARRTIPDGGEPDDVDLSETNLHQAYLYNANLEEAFFHRANLSRAFFADANLKGAFFADANLKETFFPRANLRDAHFERANLESATFFKANLIGVNLEGANLKEARFEKTRLSAHLSKEQQEQCAVYEPIIEKSN